MRTPLIALALVAMTASAALAAEEKKQYEKPADMKIDPKKTYLATIDTSRGEDGRRALPQARAPDGQQLRLPRARRSSTTA